MKSAPSLRSGRVEHFETVRRRKGGSLVEVALTISPIKNREGEIIWRLQGCA